MVIFILTYWSHLYLLKIERKIMVSRMEGRVGMVDGRMYDGRWRPYVTRLILVNVRVSVQVVRNRYCVSYSECQDVRVRLALING